MSAFGTDVTVNFEDDADANRQPLRHPMIVLFHLLFRVSALVVYLFCGLFSNSFIASFIFVVLLLSMDFWTVKNVTGRVLVGLRWWNYIDESGKSHWVYESRKEGEGRAVQRTESRIFWVSLVVCPLIWVAFFFLAIFRLNFKWFMLVIIGLILNGSNLYGYLRCKVGDQGFGSIASNLISQQAFRNMLSSFSRQKTSQTRPEGNLTGTV